MRRVIAFGGVLAAVYSLCRLLGLWRVRLWIAVAVDRLPDPVCPPHLRVLAPPDAEYVGVWAVPPSDARRRLTEQFGFAPLWRAYFHAHDNGGRRRYEVGSFVRRPEGRFGDWQLHVRLFPAGDDTEVWAHWERNPYVAPLAHLREEGYDPAEGRRRVRGELGAARLDRASPEAAD